MNAFDRHRAEMNEQTRNAARLVVPFYLMALVVGLCIVAVAVAGTIYLLKQMF